MFYSDCSFNITAGEIDFIFLLPRYLESKKAAKRYTKEKITSLN